MGKNQEAASRGEEGTTTRRERQSGAAVKYVGGSRIAAACSIVVDQWLLSWAPAVLLRWDWDAAPRRTGVPETRRVLPVKDVGMEWIL